MLVRKGVINHYDFGIPGIYQVRFIYMYLLNYVLLISMVTSPLLSQVKEREIFSWIYFRESFFFNILHGFNFAKWLPLDFSRGFIFANISFISVLYNLVFSRFVLQLVVVVTLQQQLENNFFIRSMKKWSKNSIQSQRRRHIIFVYTDFDF